MKHALCGRSLSIIIGAFVCVQLYAAPVSAQTATGAAPYCPQLTSTLRPSVSGRPTTDANTNGQVSRLQRFLARHFQLLESDVVTGYFGNLTKQAVIRFQAERHFPTDYQTGVVGAKTRQEIATVCAPMGGAATAGTSINAFSPSTGTATSVRTGCTPLASQTQTVACPTGQTGFITQTRASRCVAGATAPLWDAWLEGANTCRGAATAVSVSTPVSATVPTTLVKDIITFQIAGWSELPRLGSPRDPDWPLAGGKPAYLARTPESLAHQMDLIKGIGDHLVIAPLLMSDSDSEASGYRACWNGTPSDDGHICTGTWRYPFAMYDELRTAAKAKGVRYVPNFSVMNYDGMRGAQVLPKLKDMIAWLRTRMPDAHMAKDAQGRSYVILDSLPEQLGMTEAQKQEVLVYLKSQSDIVWIDNFLVMAPTTANYSGNVYLSTWGSEATKDAMNSQLGDHFLWWFQANEVATNPTDANNPARKIPEQVRLKWLNIEPYDPTKYPVIISQWNEYAEYLIFEPSIKSGTANYEYLKWRLSQQLPARSVGVVGTQPAATVVQTTAATVVSGTVVGNTNLGSTGGTIATPDPTTAQVSQLYREYLHKEPDASGLAYWVAEVKSGAMSIAKLTRIFQVTYLYQSVMGREPDAAGLNYWVGELESGAITLEGVRQSFVNCMAISFGQTGSCRVSKANNLDALSQQLAAAAAALQAILRSL